MKDKTLIERLKAAGKYYCAYHDLFLLCREAATEIERMELLCQEAGAEIENMEDELITLTEKYNVALKANVELNRLIADVGYDKESSPNDIGTDREYLRVFEAAQDSLQRAIDAARKLAAKTIKQAEPVAYQDTAKPTEIVAAEDWENIDSAWHWMYRPLYAAPQQAEPMSSLQRYNEIMAEDPEIYTGNALERLRFFCSLAMPEQDWLDVETFFDDVEKELDVCGEREQKITEAIRNFGLTLVQTEQGFQVLRLAPIEAQELYANKIKGCEYYD